LTLYAAFSVAARDDKASSNISGLGLDAVEPGETLNHHPTWQANCAHCLALGLCAILMGLLPA